MRTASRPALHTSDAGTGEPVLLVTGWTISSAVFDPVADLYLPHLRVVAYDHRGTGRSAPWLGPVSMAMLAADAARVLDERGLDHAHVVGVSMGAMIALELAARMPHRLRSLVLVGGSAGGPSTTLPSPGDAAFAVGEVLADSVRHRTVWPEAVLFSRRFRDEHPVTVHRLTRPFTRHRAPPWAAGWQALAASCFSRGRALDGIRTPTLLVHGDEDVMVPFENGVRLADGIRGARLHVERGAGHAVPLERPERCAEMLLAWVGEHADVVPAPATRLDAAAERITRPFALHAGAWRNGREAGPALARSAGLLP